MNEYEEIRMQVLAHAKSLRELSRNFESVMESYRRYGFEMPQVFYTDNVVADENMLEAYSTLTFGQHKGIIDRQIHRHRYFVRKYTVSYNSIARQHQDQIKRRSRRDR
jgi:Holliday junction resolvasome RuvABC endonuclease subunit